MKIDENIFNRHKIRPIEDLSLITESLNDNYNIELQGVMGMDYGPWDEHNNQNTLENMMK